jgi:hypothetical protein
MEHNLIHKYGDNHQLIRLSIKQLLELPIENWKHNRPPDEIRVSEIETFIQKKDTLILQPIYPQDSSCGIEKSEDLIFMVKPR